MELLVETDVECPFCGEWFPLVIDTSQGDYDAVDDCSVCCRPMTLTVRCAPGVIHEVSTEAA